MDGNRQATGHSSGQFRPDSIDGDVDKYFCPGSGGRTYPHRKFDDNEAQGSERNKRIGTGKEEPEPTIGRNFKTKFEIPNEYSENIMITDSDFILSKRTSAICITADMSFKSRFEADFKREYQNVEFLFRQRTGLGGMAALPPSVAQVPGKYLCFLVTRVNDSNTIDPEHVMLAVTRLRDFMIEKGITEVSMPVYDPNRGKLSSRELYAILHVVFAETEILVYLHKKYYLSIA